MDFVELSWEGGGFQKPPPSQLVGEKILFDGFAWLWWGRGMGVVGFRWSGGGL